MSRRQRERRATRRKHAQRRAAIGSAVVTAALAGPAVAHAADISVTSSADSGAGTLRQAITTSEDSFHPGADRILIASTLSGDTVHLATGLPHVDQPLEIDGPSGANLKLDASALSDPILYFDHAGSVAISNLTFRDGTAGAGGAVYSRFDDLTIRHATFSGNTATNVGGAVSVDKDTFTVSDSHFVENQSGIDGGAIRSADSDVVIAGSTFEANSAANYGGGVADASGGSVSISGSTFDSNSARIGAGISVQVAPLTVSRSTITGNTAQAAGGLYVYKGMQLTIEGSTVVGNHATNGRGGGGSFAYSPGSISDSTFVANTASGRGGGFVRGFATGPLTVTNSTISGNHAGVTGGGMYVDAGYAAVTPVALESSTVAGNAADLGGGGVFELNGAADPAPGVTLHNTIVGENTSQNGQADLQRGLNVGPFTGAFSLIQHAPPSGDLTETVPGSNVIGEDPQLAPPADNGGPTQTQALQPGSPAIDAGSSSLFCDQRGFTRPIGRAPDIGAFESGSSASANCASPPASSPGGGGTTPITTPGPGVAAAKVTVGKFKAGKDSITVTLSCASASCNGNIALATLEELKGKQVVGLAKTKRVKVGSKAYALAAGQTKKVTVKLNRTGKKLLTRYRKMKVRVSVSQRKATGSQVVKTGKVTLKRKKK